MLVENSLLTNSTKMSLDQRFTQLRTDTRTRGLRRRMSISDLRADDLRQQTASAKSRRLALQMSNRPSVIAALNGGAGPNRRGNFTAGGMARRGGFRGRGGRGAGLRTIGRDRRPNGNFGGGNRLRRSSSVGRLGRSQSVDRLSRSQSLQSLNSFGSLSTSPFRNRGGRGRGRGINRANFGAGTLSGIRTGRVGDGPRGRGRGRGRGFIPKRNDNFRQRRGGRGGFNQNRFQQQQPQPQQQQPQPQPQQGRGRGRGRGRGAGLRRAGNNGWIRAGARGGRQQQGPPPTKEKLDMELDEYMSATKSNLDREIDTYMSKTEEVWEA